VVVIAFWQNRQKGQVVAFLDPDNVTKTPSPVPARSRKMDD